MRYREQRRADLEVGGALFQRTPRNDMPAIHLLFFSPRCWVSRRTLQPPQQTDARDLLPQAVEVEVKGAGADAVQLLRQDMDRGVWASPNSVLRPWDK